MRIFSARFLLWMRIFPTSKTSQPIREQLNSKSRRQKISSSASPKGVGSRVEIAVGTGAKSDADSYRDGNRKSEIHNQ